MKILLLDNYDSFTYNLLHYLELNDGVEVVVRRNNEVDFNEVDSFDKILLSPGPGLPAEAGLLNDIISHYGAIKPMLGVCLGMQAMAEVFHGKLFNLPRVMHGVSRVIKVTDSNEILFKGMPSSFLGGRYHSWVVDKMNLPDCFRITAVDENNDIMAFRHKEFNLCGVQFHPESVLTEFGMDILKNWLLST